MTSIFSALEPNHVPCGCGNRQAGVAVLADRHLLVVSGVNKLHLSLAYRTVGDHGLGFRAAPFVVGVEIVRIHRGSFVPKSGSDTVY